MASAVTNNNNNEAVLNEILKVLKATAPPNPAEEKKRLEMEAQTAKDMAAVAAAAKKKAAAEEKAAAEAKALEEKKKTSFGLMGDLFKGFKESSMDYFEKTEQNQITWGGLGKAMKASVKNWFDKAKKSNSLLGKSLRFFSTVAHAWKTAVQQFSKVFATIVGHVREVLGPVAAAFDVAKEAIMSTFNFFKGIIGHFFQQMPPGDKKRNKLLQIMAKEMIRSKKAKARGGDGKGQGFLENLKGKLTMIKGIVTIIGSLMMTFIGIGVLIYGAYQFFKGFQETPGTFWDKMKGGYSRALKKILYYPLKIFEWLLIQMGIDAEGLTDKVMSWIDPFVDFIVDFNPFRPLVEFIIGFMGTEGTFWEKVKGGMAKVLVHVMGLVAKWGPILADAISPIIEGVTNFFKGFWNSAVDWMISQLPDWGFLEDTKSWLEGMKLETGGTSDAGGGSSLADEVEKNRKAEAEAAKAKADAEQAARDEQRRLGVAQLNAQKAAADGTTAIANANAAGGGGGGDGPPQIPEEVDNWGVTSKNYDMEEL